jgi:MFS family permease
MSAAERRVLAARGLRAFGDGYVSLLLPAYLLELGFGPLQVGMIATGTLCGSAVLTLGVGAYAHRVHARTLLLGCAALMSATGFLFASAHEFWPLLIIAVVGTLNPSSGDVSVFLPLEHAVLARGAGDLRRTAAFARYALVGTLVAAFGALAASIPTFLTAPTQWPVRSLMQAMFAFYGVLGVLVALVYRGLPRAERAAGPPAHVALGASRGKVYTLAALFGLDAFAGGFVVQSMLALWLYQRFGMSLATVGTIFFWTSVLSALSYLVAVKVANRIGLVNTMVFSHLPANLCLVIVPWVDNVAVAIGLLLVRSALSQMDVPTRSSYVMAIVTPAERPAAASVTAVPRSLASAVSPLLAGYLLGLSTFGWSLVAAGGLKIVYDLLLLATFRRIRPPEEASRANSRSPD